ncbi:MAG TPA: serine hydrolase domain-containing protein [Aliidongia sp.]|uniref:serine hydrolase domain-containing protein n=1 Tax=Aliidongia sp. TaxID=1914230 RepID=UPI002DDD2B45|nr:serine hydrolase domain-containing protein [Aliidongia sp.]HEV2677712.1 serine hydrolase domain-containing protein [Aliidongia sp.]
MKRFTLALAALLALAPSARAADPIATDPKVLAAVQGLEQTLGSEVAKRGFPGMAVAVIHDQTPLWIHSYGEADHAGGVAVSENTQFRVASITKLFTAVAIMQLRDAGLLNLDDPVQLHLTTFRLAGVPHPTVTIRELLLQLGGLPREPLGTSWQERVMPSRDQLMADLDHQEPAIPPETQWKYSNLGYAILGQLVKAVSDERFEDYVLRHIAQPLGMTHTLVNPPEDLKGIAVGYGYRQSDGARAPRAFMKMGGMYGAAGVISTAADLGRFAAFFLSEADSPVLSAATRREMLRAQAVLPDWSGGQGLGFEIRRVAGQSRIGHAGRGAGYAGRLDIDPVSKLGVIVLINADENGPTRFVDEAFSALVGPVMAASALGRPPVVADPAWSKFVGRYTNEGRDSEIVLADGRLAWQDAGFSDPAHTRIPLEPAGGNVFKFTAGALVGEKLIFDLDPAGKVVSMHAAGNTDLRK